MFICPSVYYLTNSGHFGESSYMLPNFSSNKYLHTYKVTLLLMMLENFPKLLVYFLKPHCAFSQVLCYKLHRLPAGTCVYLASVFFFCVYSAFYINWLERLRSRMHVPVVLYHDGTTTVLSVNMPRFFPHMVQDIKQMGQFLRFS